MERINIKSDFIGQIEPGGLVVAKIDSESVVGGSNPLARGYIELRTRKYQEYGFLDTSVASDINFDDERSDHYVALESNQNGTSSVVGTMRMINREVEDGYLLPIESMFDESLDVKVTPKVAEISRLIVEAGGQPKNKIRTTMIQTALKETLTNGTRQTLAMVDPWFRDFLRDRAMIPLTEVTQERKFGKYPEAQVGIDVDFHTLERNMGAKALTVAFKEEGITYYRF